MRFRKLRIAWSVFWGLACVPLIVLWVRSYGTLDQIKWHPKPKQVAALRSESGIAGFHYFDLTGAANEDLALWEADFISDGPYSLDAWPAFIFPNPESPGYRIFVPYWLLVALAGAFATVSWIRWRFSLRTLLIATTLVAVVLGLAVWASRH